MKNDRALTLNTFLEAIQNINCFMTGVTEKEFLENTEKQYAVLRVFGEMLIVTICSKYSTVW